MPRVFIADKLESAGIDILQKAGLEVDNRPGLKGDDLKAALRSADAVIVRSATRLTAELLADAGKLRAIARAGVGVDTIDVSAATKKGIVVMNTPDGNTVSAAEQTIALLTALARHIPAAHASMLAGQWDRNRYVGVQLEGKVLGIIGLGRIGREVAKRARGLGMTVIGYDAMVNEQRVQEMGFQSTPSIDDMLPQVDFLTVHVPLNDDTRGLLSDVRLKRMKKTARVLNVSRGGIYDEAALAAALSAGTIAGAGIDVFSEEPPKPDHPLRTAPNVILTPHLGASTLEAQETVAIQAAELIRDFVLKGVVANAVNMVAVDRKELDELRYYVILAYRLGLLHAQMAKGNPEKVRLIYRGDLTQKKTKLLTDAFTVGLFEHRVADVNLVNASHFAQDSGIDIIEEKDAKKGDFASMMLAEVTTDRKTYTAGGTLFGDQHLRLVQLGSYRLEAYLDGTLFIFTHFDRPGLIGFVGSVFGKHQVNIAAMNLGRVERGGEAIGVLNLDSVPSAAALEEVGEHEFMKSVSVVRLPDQGAIPAWLG